MESEHFKKPEKRKRQQIEGTGTSKYRDTYAVGPDGGHIAKVPKERVEKNYPLIGRVSYPTSLYTLLKFGATNVNEVDYKNYLSLPQEVREAFTSKMRLMQGIVVQERVVNYDGTPSLSIEEYTQKFGKISNDFFWTKVDELKQILLALDAPPLDVFHYGGNIMVKKVSETEWMPILIDFKRLGARSYPFQVNLMLSGQVRKKFLRRFERFEQTYRPVASDE